MGHPVHSSSTSFPIYRITSLQTWVVGERDGENEKQGGTRPATGWSALKPDGRVRLGASHKDKWRESSWRSYWMALARLRRAQACKVVIAPLSWGCFCVGHRLHFLVLAEFVNCVGHLDFNMRKMASKVVGIILDDQLVVKYALNYGLEYMET